MRKIPTFKSGDLLTTAFLQGVAAGLAEVQSRAVFGGMWPLTKVGNSLGLAVKIQAWWIGKVSAAVEGETVFTDCRYWVDLYYCSLTAADNEEAKVALTKEADTTRKMRVVASNLSELVSNSHQVAVDTPIIVYEIDDNGSPSTDRFVFEKGFSGIFPVKVVKDGGVAGSPTTTCTFTYTLKDLAGTTIKKNPAGDNATSMTPLRPRYANCEYDQPADDSYGKAFFDASGNLQLYECVQEKPKGDVVRLQSQYAIDGPNKKFYVKYRQVLVLEAYDEDGTWTQIHLGALCP